MGAPNWFFSACAFIGFVLCTIPLPWHLEAWNTGTCLYMIWAALGCLIQFINSVVWNSNVIDKAPVWCDITSKFMIGCAVALPAASLCINRRLYYIVSVDSVTRTRAEKRRDVLVDLSIGLGIPILEMILRELFITSFKGHRFNIFEEIGCYPTTYNTPPAYALVFCWPVAIGLVSAVYCNIVVWRSVAGNSRASFIVCTIRELALRRAQFKELLSANRNMSSSRYFRLMGLAGIEVLGTIPIGAYVIYLNVTVEPIQPWISWANTHYDFSRVAQYPSVVWQAESSMAVSLQMSRWLYVACAFVFFGFFGFADEARRNYRLAYTSIAKKVGISTGMLSSGTWGTGKTCRTMVVRGCPVFITQRTDTKRDSLASFSTNLSIGDYGNTMRSSDDKKPPYSATTSGGSISKESLPPTAAAAALGTADVPADFNDITLPSFPESILDLDAPPRHIPDAPSSLRTSLDI
ncbi:STE3-domain-containing protein [Pisolithus orientalis]|uniref:STE3-domain-containing protein n=1 Tax=Pisolithus orientalis TaxID=936130 RepID=UPI002225A82C|nr:STE3-domain-containing protein [Pisolithus orientalis]KAI6002477.1 STE3-domain-containing protein [Pisolithus orientalis]